MKTSLLNDPIVLGNKTSYSNNTENKATKARPIAMMPVGFGAATIDEDYNVTYKKMSPEELDMKLIEETLGFIKKSSKESVDKVLRFADQVVTVHIDDADDDQTG